MAYAQSLENEIAELRAHATAPAATPASTSKPSKIIMPTPQTPSWRQHLVAGIVRHSRRG
jgi:hypothetical protein